MTPAERDEMARLRRKCNRLRRKWHRARGIAAPADTIERLAQDIADSRQSIAWSREESEKFLRSMYGQKPGLWSHEEQPWFGWGRRMDAIVRGAK